MATAFLAGFIQGDWPFSPAPMRCFFLFNQVQYMLVFFGRATVPGGLEWATSDIELAG